MKKTIFCFILGLLTITSIYAQQTVVIQRPGILTDLAEAATALVALPAAAAVGFVSGTVEAVRDVAVGSTTVIRTPAPVVVATPIVTSSVTLQPIVVSPSPQVIVPISPIVITPTQIVTPNNCPMTTITTTHRDGTTVSVTRSASSYELGPTVIVPVSPEHRVGPSPLVNPYIFRP